MKAMRFLAILLALTLLASGQALALQINSGGERGDGNAIFTAVFNDSGATLQSGSVVIWDTGAGDPTDVGLGAYVTTTTTADTNLVAGVVHQSTILDQGIGAIQIYGPRQTLFAHSTDNTGTIGAALGTTTVAGQAGSGTGLGCLLRTTGSTVDGELEYIFINPSNAE